MVEWIETKRKGQTELRARIKNDLLIIHSKQGWTYNNETPKNPRSNTSGFELRISMNGPIWLRAEDWEEIKIKIDALVYGKQDDTNA